MTSCAKCNQDIVDKYVLTCSRCQNLYHVKCTVISEKLFNLMRTKESKNWSCVKCIKAPMGRTSTSSTPSITTKVSTQNRHTPTNYVTDRVKYRANIPTENSFESLPSDDASNDDSTEILNRSCPSTGYSMKEELEELKMKIHRLEIKLQTAENEIDNLGLENCSLKKQVMMYERKTNKLTQICKSTPIKNRKGRRNIDRTRLNFTDGEQFEMEFNNNLSNENENMDMKNTQKDYKAQAKGNHDQIDIRSQTKIEATKKTEPVEEKPAAQPDEIATQKKVVIFSDEYGKGLRKWKQVGCATDDDFAPFACSLGFAVKHSRNEAIVSWPFYELGFVTLLLFAVDKHLATTIMELMNRDLLMRTKDLLPGPVTTFRQDPKLASAIDKLFRSSHQTAMNQKDEGGLLLPERKLEFTEVQQLLSHSTKDTVRVEKPVNVMIEELNRTKKATIKKVEDILADVNRTAETGETPKLVIRNQRLWGNCIYDLDRVTLKSFPDAKKTTLLYSSTEDKTRFNRIVFVLTKVHELLSKNLIVTRRELFYQNVHRLRNQANLDVAVRDVCCLLESPPWDLGIVATSKGLIAGPLTIHTRDGSLVDCMSSNGSLIMQDINGIKKFESTAKYILVVEKDAVFQKLLDEGALVRLGPVIIMTGKGYPDVCTRQLLCRLCSELRLPALALVDADPHGFEIFLTYKYGSLAQSHLSSSLACISLSLLGARHQDVLTLAPKEARLPLTDLDIRKLTSLLKRPYLDTPSGSRIKNELNTMLLSGVKAEIEALAPTSAALCDAYLPLKIIQAEYLA